MKHSMRFEKYQGCGNDFILVDEMTVTPTLDEVRSDLAKRLCDRHFGIGADGIIFLEQADGCDGSMRLFEPAGNEADMCGNGLRCVAALLSERRGLQRMSILTRDGVKEVVRDGSQFRVDMGPVRTLRRDISQYVADKGQPTDSMLDVRFLPDENAPTASVLNTGEPHVVVFTEDVRAIDVVGIGSLLNADRRRFPLGININFVQVTGGDGISIRTYERGVYDETMACGTGATACAAASLLLRKLKEGVVSVSTRGGVLRIEVREDGRAFMTGPATKVYDGSIEVDV
jgi:diaminopimelate epimerase